MVTKKKKRRGDRGKAKTITNRKLVGALSPERVHSFQNTKLISPRSFFFFLVGGKVLTQGAEKTES
jgi:hypothetical protein